MAIADEDGLGMQDGQGLKGANISGLYKATLGNGVLAGTVLSTALKITEDEAAADFTVTAQLGIGRINGTLYIEAADIEDIAVTAAHATDERIDLVIYDQSGSTVAIVDGTPHATDPQIPDVTDDDDLPLAYIYVVPQDDGGYTGTIVDGDIHDLRAFIPTGTRYLWMPGTDFHKTIDALLGLFGAGGSAFRGIDTNTGVDSDVYHHSFFVPPDMLLSEAVELWVALGTDADESATAIRLVYEFMTISLAGAVEADHDYATTVATTKLDGAAVSAQIQVNADVVAAMETLEPCAFSWQRAGTHGDDTADNAHIIFFGWYLKYTAILG